MTGQPRRPFHHIVRGFGHGEPHYFAHRLDLMSDDRFRQLLEFLDPVGIPGADTLRKGRKQQM
jgi:hypothetical protein